MASVSGLALAIRNSTESDTFDLAGQSPSTITSAVTAAFSDPLPLSSMVRLTFVTGAGKLGRQKYDEGAAKAVTSALRALGYEEDRAASCVVECAGTFKSQHDTGKNLKTVVVFPRVDGGGDDADAAAEGVARASLDDRDDGGPSSLPSGTPTHVCAVSSTAVFAKMLASKCPSWSQKKGCANALREVGGVLKQLEERLGRGEPLSDADQDLYDSVTYDSLTEKEALVKKETQAQVEAGHLTAPEKEMLVAQVTERVAALRKDVAQAEKENKPKKLEKLRAMLEKSTARAAKLEEITPTPPHRLKHEGDIVKLRVEIAPLVKMENAAKGRLLSMKETMTLARKDDILEEIAEFERKSRGWFESDEAFQMRLENSRRSTQSSAKQRAAKKNSGGASKSGTSLNTNIYKKPSTNWVTPGSRTQKKAPAKKKANQGQSVFSMMMMDSDSD